ncbi:MAG: glutamate formimidoyltransferase [Acidobacteriota bacterium]
MERNQSKADPRLESIPNFSEGRRGEILRGLQESARGAPGVTLLDSSADPDHHRSVFTLAGQAQDLENCLFSLIRQAIETIDLRQHRGVHPRIGAVDVVPFVHLEDDTNPAAAVPSARRLGERVAEGFETPVFLYGAAASHEGRPSLPQLRRGGLPGLRRRMIDGIHQPDFGPSRPHPTAGVAVIGARPFLIALNVILNADALPAARRIAKRVRESSGGLPALQALGLSLDARGRGQVSMNLLDYRRTSPAQAVAAVAECIANEAVDDGNLSRGGLQIEEVEIIGLVPQAALPREVRSHWVEQGWSDEETLTARLLEPRLPPMATMP